ncbi:MAG: bifunctional diaminohydroxyphosphoribosylaminopyrimidine deaminase/5-amino-6-(5-phosphoribosylamino)uracil reductase RibD, partial [Deltaproteobacteria bacterium]|nr:bifunctional diaminohydroxyphosphoribosylaminopyrimidine deaminase/5-amino-6-(5-phosphoribosylamino)uracil reductase RibD [Deltaproteobacteria bacterium]
MNPKATAAPGSLWKNWTGRERPSFPLRTLHQKMMALALKEARKGKGRTSPNPVVGAVVARGERVVSRGYHARAGRPHAEAAALERAGTKARGATLYVTLEPCNHEGRTPPCTQAILTAGIRRVIIGDRDDNPHVTGGGAKFLAAQGLEVQTGVLGRKCHELNEFYHKHVTTGLPFILLKSAATLDGRIATVTGDSRWVTQGKARAYVHRLRRDVDAILVGRGTVEKDDPSLTTRLPGRRRGQNPIRLVLDTHLRLPLSARLFDLETGGPAIVVCGPRTPASKVRAFEKIGVEVLLMPLFQGRVSLAKLSAQLGARDIQGLLIEGGAEVNASALLGERIVDKVLFFYAPKIIGGLGAPNLVGGAGV